MLRIAVAGHRRLDGGQISRIKSELDRVAADIVEVLSSYARQPIDDVRAAKQSELRVSIRLVSSLAEGADRIAFELPRFQKSPNIQLERSAILPFPRAIYCGDFDADNSVIDNSIGTVGEFLSILESLQAQGLQNSLVELNGDPDKRDAAYNAASKALVAASDLLIAIYDQRNYTGVGTAYTVHSALAKGMPVIHIPNSEGPSLIVHSDGAGGRQSKQYSQQGLLAVLQELNCLLP